MRLQLQLVGVLVGLCGLAHAATTNRDVEVLGLVKSFHEGVVSPNQLVNRVTYLGAEKMVIDLLVQSMKESSDPRRRGLMLDVLAQIATPSPAVETVVIQSLSDDPLGNRMTAAKMLGKLKSVKALPKLEAMLGDPTIGTRREAARALGLIAKPRAGPALMAAATIEEDLETRNVMLSAIGATGDRRQTSPLEAFLQDSSESARLVALQSLCLLGSAKGQAFAQKVLTSKDRLERLQGVRLFEGTPLRVAKPALSTALDDPDPAVRAAAGRVLVEAGESSRLTWLLFQSQKSASNPEAKAAFEAEIEKLNVTPEQREAILKKVGMR